MNTRRYTQIVFALVLLFVNGATKVWADDVTANEIIIHTNTNGTLTASVDKYTSDDTNGKYQAGDYKVTLTATPQSGYTLKNGDITVQPMVNPNASPQLHAPGIGIGISELTVTEESTNVFSFILSQNYHGAYVTATFALAELTPIESLSEITDQYGCYKIKDGVTEVSGTPGVSEFKGVLDGNLATFSLSTPLFNIVNGGVVKNVIVKGGTISGNGAIANKVIGTSDRIAVIYNCGMLGSVARSYDPITGKLLSVNCSSSVTGSGSVGGLVGQLGEPYNAGKPNCYARVINCFSFAQVSGGSGTTGGIVGRNCYESKSGDIRTMVMNCMFYGTGSGICPIYGGSTISNSTSKKLNNYNYFCYENLPTENIYKDDNGYKYNCALAAEERFLVRFEFYRQLLNSTRELAAYYVGATLPDLATGEKRYDKSQIAKWVLDKSVAPYPILKKQGYYPSVVNNISAKISTTDNSSVVDYSASVAPTTPEANKTLKVNVQGKTIYLPITDKDPNNYNYCYHKVQLPYYNDVADDNYTIKDGKSKVVTGWEITFNDGTEGTFTKEEYDVTFNGTDANGNPKITKTPYNYADRSTYAKDLAANQIYSQGAYFNVPDDVTEITLEPHWATAVYLSDPYYDSYGYSGNTISNNNLFTNEVGDFGLRYKVKTDGYANYSINGSSQMVYTLIDDAVSALPNASSVYDNAIVLVGNYHKGGDNELSAGSKPFTIMSIDLDRDNEPDYSLIYRSGKQKFICPIRFDFVNVPGMAMAHKISSDGNKAIPGNCKPQGWFEITNTALIRYNQFEYESNYKGVEKSSAPLILLGGVIEQFVSTNYTDNNGNANIEHTTNIHLGGNVWFKLFSNGVHSDKDNTKTAHHPISVTGGEFEKFYLSGYFSSKNKVYFTDNAECYIDGGKFGEVAGAGQEKIDGNVTWIVNHADIKELYGGGINPGKPISGNIYVNIKNSHIDKYCGGPKFGNMTETKTVTTIANHCEFGTYFGAGNGGTALVRNRTFNDWNHENYGWNDDNDKVGTFKSGGGNARGKYDASNGGISVSYEYEHFEGSGKDQTVGRFYVNYASLSLAQTNNVKSELTDCDITGSFYGGGNLGKVAGDATSILKGCRVQGSVYGAGYSATAPTAEVFPAEGFTNNTSDSPKPYYNTNTAVFEKGEYPKAVEYTWSNTKGNNSDNTLVDDNEGKWIHVDPYNPTTKKGINLNELGTVTGKVTLTIDNCTVNNVDKITEITGSVYGGGEESGVDGSTEVTVSGGTIGAQGNGGVEYGNVYGGGKGKRDNVTAGLVKGNTKVEITNGTIYHNVYGGGAYGSVGTYTYDANNVITGHTENTGKTEVYIKGGTFGWNGKENGMVFGSSRGDVGAPGSIEDKLAWVYDTKVYIGNEGSGSVFGSPQPQIKGSVYGGGENGHNLHNADVYIYSGTIGITTGVKVTDSAGKEYEGAAYPYRGNVYGGGCGTDKYYTSTEGVANPYDGNGQEYNSKAGIVQGNATVNISGGHVVHNVYGAGAMGSVGTETSGGKTTVNISGGRIGYDGTRNGNVFGAARGEYGFSDAASGLANVRESEVNISYTSTPTADNEGKTTQLIAGSVFGGGESGTVKGNVVVNMTGGLILKDLYGGGALADTQTSNWNTAATPNTWTDTDKKSTLHTTTVRLTGGRIVEEVFGGGLGEDGKPAYVWGDVLVDLNGETTMDNTTGKPTVNGTATTNASGCVVGQLFGGNNINGTPKGDVMVHVYATQNKEKGSIADKFRLDKESLEKLDINETTKEADDDYVTRLKAILADRIVIAEALSITVSDEDKALCTDNEATTSALKSAISGITTSINEKTSENDIKTINALRYDVKAVYGGGNQAAYNPVTPNTSTNSTPNGSQTQVIIEGCGETSIETVYGGGNAAAVPETNVDVREAYEIGSVFGGGNGKDDIAPGVANPGADVGTLDHGTSTYGTGNANTVLKGGYIHEAYGGSNQNGKIKGKVNINTNPQGTCALDVQKLVGAGKNADVDGDLIMILGCKPATKTPLVFAGADNADVNGNVELTITSGTFGQVFGGNNLGGHIKGHIKLNIEETGCNPIRIDELYLGGNQAEYSIYGYYNAGTTENPNIQPRTAAMHAITDTSDENYKAPVGNPDNTDGKHPFPYAEPVLNVISATSIGKVFGGGLGAGAVMYADPTVNINMIPGAFATQELGGAHKLGIIGDVYGGGNEASVIGNTTVNIGTETTVGLNTEPTYLAASDYSLNSTTGKYDASVEGANITGSVYGGGQLADVGKYDVANDNVDVVGNTYVNIGAKYNTTSEKWESVAEGTSKVLIAGNVFGGGEGEAAESGAGAFKCAKAIVTGGTNIHIGNGTINGTVYGGGEVGRVEGNSEVAIGIGAGGTTPASAPTILGDVFGAGKGKKTHGYSALMRGNPTVTIEGDAKVRGSVYGGGEIASVGRYNVKKGDNDPVGAPDDVLVGMPYSLANSGSGYCTVNIRGNAEIGPEAEMKMTGTTSGKPDDTGHVIGGGKGVLPYDGYGVTDDDWVGDPWRVSINDQKDIFNESNATYTTNYEKEYFKYIETLALATETNVTISGNAFVKGSVYGGSLNGHVQHDTHVNIAGGQIGAGENVNRRYTVDEWASLSLAECPHWDYVANSGAPYDPLATTSGTYDYTNYGFVPTAARKTDSDGGLPVAKDGHTYYGNVFGGGSGVIPYAPGLWHRGAGSVGGDTYVNITGGHILSSVYGGNEHTDVGTYTKDASGQPTTTPAEENARGKCTINMTGGTVGVPRTDAQKIAHPLVGNVFGAGKGDQRIFFNTWTNVINTEVNISGNARIYGSVFGGGEDGHVISDAETNIGGTVTIDGTDYTHPTETSATNPGVIIGTTGTSYSDGNVFGGGRGFSGEAQTAGTVGGNVRLNINAGSVYGSVYGGGRLASVGTMFEFPTQSNGEPNPAYGQFKEDETGANAKTYGHVTINISGGTIGNENATGDGAKYSGNVFGGSMGRLELLNSTRNPIWPKMAQVKETNVNIYGSAVVRRSVYGGGELGTVRENAYVTIGGYKTADADDKGNVAVTTSAGDETHPTTVRRDVYGGGYGSEDKNYTIFTIPELISTNPDTYESHTYAFTPMQFAGCVGKNTYVNVVGGYIRKSVYGGGEMASVGVINYRAAETTSEPAADKVKIGPIGGKTYYYEHMIKHGDPATGFALSWPYEFEYVDGYDGATHVKITGGRLGVKDTESEAEKADIGTDNGDVYGAGKGQAGDFKDYLFCANVGSTDVKIAYTSTPEAYTGTGDLVAGAVYGGGEDGHVMGDTKMTISGGLIYHSVYGGGSGKGTYNGSLLKIGATVGSTTESDYYTRKVYSITAGKVFGNTEVNMSGGYVVRNIYGGGNMGSVGKGNYAGGSDDYSTDGYGEKIANLWSNTDFTGSGKCTVKISGGTIGYIDTDTPSNSMYPKGSSASLPYGNVFGGCRGEAAPDLDVTPSYLYSPEFFMGYVNETEVTIEGADTKILGSVYGGGMDGHVRRDASVTIKGGEIGKTFDATSTLGNDPNNIQWLARGNVYGAGSGIGEYNASVVQYSSSYTGTQLTGTGKSTSAGSVTGSTTVDIQGGTIHRNVYGGGSLASVGAPKIPADRTDNPTKTQTLNTVTISGGQIGGDYSYDANGNYVYGGRVFGGSRGDATLDATKFSTSMFTSVTVNANASDVTKPTIAGSVFGGGEIGIVKGSVDVTMNGGTVNHDVYGGGALANTNTETSSGVPYTTTVNLYGGLVKGDAYGGGLGQLGVTAVTGVHWTAEEIADAQEGDPAYGKTTDDWKVAPVTGVSAVPALVYGNVAVNLGDEGRNGATAFDVNKYTEGTHAGIVKSGRVFGCNNLNGSPQGSVTVTVNKTVKGNTDKTDSDDLKSSDATKHKYHVAAVYGGGNLAGKTVGGSTNVIINGCEVSIRSVYGGGNAAEVPATDVLVNGAYEIGEVFGGGNGKDDYTLDGGSTWKTNPGANVNGNTNTLLLGGLIHEAYGGSNEKGTITGSVSINTGAPQPSDCSGCPLDVEKIVGAGKNADVNGDLIMVLGCKPETKTPLVFGGADNANVNGNVELTITSGTFGQVFGGNNLGGVIRGHIVLNIEETGCNPIKIDELYLGGNQAAYSRYGYYNAGTTDAPDIKPRTAEMHAITNTADPNYKAPVGNPTEDANHPFPYAQPVLNVVSCTSIGKVFGGGLGTGAIMHADPTVNINMIRGAFANNDTKGVPYVMNAMNLSSDDNPNKLGIIGDVYGGGNAADVIGNPTVNIGTAATVQLHQSYTNGAYSMSGDQNVLGAYINGNVFGGGMGKADEFTCAKAMVGEVDKGIDTENNPLPGGTSVVIAKGTVNGNVYGGGEIGRVERNTKVTIGIEGDQTSVPVIKGSVFGAGKGLETHGYSALVRGNAEVIIQGGAQVLQTIHGGGEKASVGRYNVRLPGDTQHPEVKVGMPYSLKAGGKCTVMIQDGAVIGKEANTGDVYGAGQGVVPAYNNTEGSANRSKRMVTYTSEEDYPATDKGTKWDYYEDENGVKDTRYVWEYFTTKDDYLLYMETLARASETDVIIGGKRVTIGESVGSIVASSTAPTVKGSVYGGSESGFVYQSTAVNMLKGTVKGDVFGGGKGLDSYAEAGRVRINTNLTISGGVVERNVYGGGSLGDVGIIDKSDQTDYNFKWKQTDGTTYNVVEYNKNATTTAANNTGICNVTISGGTIGTGVAMSADGTYANGNVYGAGKGLEDTWWCEKAMVFATSVNISAGTIKGTVYGGGEVGRVEDDAKVTIGVLNASGNTAAPNITGNVFGAGAGIKTHGYSALVRGNADVTVQGIAQVGGSVYGGGEIASVGRFHVVKGLPQKPESGGYCTVTIQDKAKIGSDGTGHDVFGACKGVTPAYDASNYKSVYSMQTYENRPSNTPGDTWDYYITYPEGYQGQMFIKRYYKTEPEYLAFLKTLALTSHPHVTIAEEAEVHGSVYGGGQRGVTLGKVDVDITGGTISQDVYGGGALADTNLGNWDEQGYVVATALNEGELITDLYTRSGTEAPYTYTKITDATTDISSGTYYRQQATWAHETKSAYYQTKVNILGGTIGGDAYGGGLGQLEVKTGETVTTPAIEAKVYGDVYMNLNGFDKNEVEYVAATHGATGDGARLELSGNEYLVKDAVQGAIVKHIFGCNNLNGSPQGKVKVHVFKTQRAGETRITNAGDVTTAKVHVEKDNNGDYNVALYDVQAVYGGGNMAAYVPKDLTDGTTQVVIDGCDRTSIGQVYGGGNAASTPATEVTVNGTFEIAEVFGGGNGKDKITVNGVEKDNPGANVGFKDYSAVESTYPTKADRQDDDFVNNYVYGTGKASVNIFGGTVHRVFGGSNTKGNVRQTAVTMLEDASDCEFCVDEAYGGGKSAEMDAEAKLLMACIPGLNAAYGGAEAADVHGNVTLNITNGTFDRVFGGNNKSGTISGSITVNISEVGCKPIIIGELYGGGNLAGYSVYGYNSDGSLKESGSNPYNDPQVNVKSFTSIGTIYGGGYGSSAVMVGNPTVTVSVAEGDWKDYVGESSRYTEEGYTYNATGYKGETLTITDDNGTHDVVIPSHDKGKIGAINNVFGGGNAAKVIGNTNVNIGTLSKVTVWSYVEKAVSVGSSVEGLYTRSGEGTVANPYRYTEKGASDVAVEGITYYEEKEVEKDVLGVDIRGNVYGGGNNAEVTGDTNVTIGKKETTP